uniref:F-box/LRR-repeat protein 15-like leucin rich repeat domain-containing protein n=1 Tax=Kalanchoe fedtschenkoi TaxID=63787 RepID=A0A7N0VN47_KALFE
MFCSLLTDDLLLRILEKLDDDADRRKWRLVCKDFLRVDCMQRTSLRVLRAEFLPNLIAKYGNATRLDLSVCPRIDDGTLSFLLSRGWAARWFGRLKEVVLLRTTGLKPTGLEMLIRACRNLERLDVSHSLEFGDRECAAMAWGGGLREVRMDKCLNVTDVGLVKVAVGCPKLESVSLKWCLEVTDMGIDLLVRKCQGLKSLDISYLQVTNESLKSISSLQKLEVLGMVRCQFVDDAGLEYLGTGCPSLQIVDISRCKSISTIGLNSLIGGHRGLTQLVAGYNVPEPSPAFLTLLSNLKNLKSIRIDGARVSESYLQTITDNCKLLTEVGLSKCKGVTDNGIIQLVSRCINLRILDLTCCDTVGDAAISAVANSCRNLNCLKLEACKLVTMKSLQSLGSHSILLKEIDLTDCYGVVDKGLFHLSKCFGLASLKLGLCANITDEGLSSIASKCSRIYELDLYRCAGIGDNGLAALSNGCTRLKILNLSYCTKITDQGLAYIGQMDELLELEMRGLVNITNTGFTAVVAGCRRLSELDIKHCENVTDSGFWALAYHGQNLRQLNISNCSISDTVLCMLMGNLTRLQDIKLVDLSNITVEGLELALKACRARIKKVKFSALFTQLLSVELMETLKARGCKIRGD